MGCTTLDSMLNNWVEGHEWIRVHFGPQFEPRVGWSLDPFGPSSTQAVLQAFMGMDAWFFTRIGSDVVDAMKKAQSLEFVWVPRQRLKPWSLLITLLKVHLLLPL